MSEDAQVSNEAHVRYESVRKKIKVFLTTIYVRLCDFGNLTTNLCNLDRLCTLSLIK